MAKVIIAEKPSVAKNIAEALGAKNRRDGFYEGEGYFITWAFGHLLELKDAKAYDEKMASWRMEHYPFIPETFEYQVKRLSEDRSKEDAGAKKQLMTIQQLIHHPETVGVISATDFDREGQIIGDLILEYLQVKKPVERLLLNEWTREEVLGGLNKLISNGQMQPLRDAGIGRQWADWLIGINLTSVATLKYQRGARKPLNVGRVLMPTLKIIYDRDLEIERFVPEAYHRLKGLWLLASGETYEAYYEVNKQDKFEDKLMLEACLEAVKGKMGCVESLEVEEKKEYPPSLFNLSGLQGYITSKEKGWTSDKVLKVAQGLYEKKLITYPRTASLALEESLIPKAKKVLESVREGLPHQEQIVFHTGKRVFDNSKVESHSAIIPTYIKAKGLTPDEQKVYEAVRNRFVMQFMPVAVFEEAVLITRVEDCPLEGRFVSKGRIQKIMGWKHLEQIQSKDKVLPAVKVGETVKLKKAELETKETSPPKKHTEKTLLRVMETCGKKYKDDAEDEMIAAILSGFSIGTPATRAETISKLKAIGYIGVKGKNLYCTPMGRRMVELFPIRELFDLEYTGRLEKNLSEIGKGQIPMESFMETIKTFTADSVEVIKADAFHLIGESEETQSENRVSLGPCPSCGAPVYESEKQFGCSNWKSGCKFSIWKDDRFLTALKVRATAGTISRLLENGHVYSASFISKKGTKFSAWLTYDKNEETGYYKWQLHFEQPPERSHKEA